MCDNGGGPGGQSETNANVASLHAQKYCVVGITLRTDKPVKMRQVSKDMQATLMREE